MQIQSLSNYAVSDKFLKRQNPNFGCYKAAQELEKFPQLASEIRDIITVRGLDVSVVQRTLENGAILIESYATKESVSKGLIANIVDVFKTFVDAINRKPVDSSKTVLISKGHIFDRNNNYLGSIESANPVDLVVKMAVDGLAGN